VDFQLYARVLWRFKLLVVLGLLLGLALATLSLVRVSPDGLTYRQSELWSSTTQVGVTQKGFPWGRLFAQDITENPTPSGIPVADPNRLNNLAVLYAELAMSDPVRRLMREEGPVRGKIIATPLVRGDNRIMLPLIDLTAIAESPPRAIELSMRSAEALETYVRRQQIANEVPPADRVVVERVMRPRGALVYQPRSKTMPIVILFAVMFATVALAFLLENVRPRARPGEPAEVEHEDTAQRRSA
jgi:hypothetical protein